MGKEKTEARILARELYVHSQKTQKEIADIVGVSQKTVIEWIRSNDWDDLKASKSVTKGAIIRNYYKAILALQDQINNRNAPENVPTSKEADIMAKIQNNISRLENNQSLADMIDVGEKFIKYLQENSPKDLQLISTLLYGFYERMAKELE